MQAEIGRQLRSEYEAPQELSTDLASSLARMDNPQVAPPEVRSRFCVGADRGRKRLQRALACEEAAGRALNQGIKEIYLDLAAQLRDLAHQDELL